MAKKLILGIILFFIAISTIFLISGIVYNDQESYDSYNTNCNAYSLNCNDDNVMIMSNSNDHYDNVINMNSNTNTYSNDAPSSTKVVDKNGCYEEIIQIKDPGECMGVQQEKKQCYQHIITCSGMRTQSIDCNEEVPQTKGDGECIGVQQEKGQCYKQVESCSGTKTISIDCYPTIEQEKGYGECLNIPQEKGQCYKVKEYKTCY